MELASRRSRRVHRRAARRAEIAADGPGLPREPAALPGPRVRSPLPMVGGLQAALRYSTGPDLLRVEHRSHSADYEGRPARRSLTKPELSACSTTPTSKVGAARTAAGRAGWRHCGTRQRRRSPTPGVCDAGSHLKERPRSRSTCRADPSPPRIGAVVAASVTMTSVEALEASWPCTTWLTRHRLG